MVRLKGLQIAINAVGETQASVARKLGVAAPNLCNWATKECNRIPADRIKQLSELLNVSIDFIFNAKEFEKK